MLFEKSRRRHMLTVVIGEIEKSSIVRDAIYTVEAKYPKGQSPASEVGRNAYDIKRAEAIQYIIKRLKTIGIPVFEDDLAMLEYLSDKIKAAHADASMDKNSKYNEPETEPTIVYSGGSVTYR